MSNTITMHDRFHAWFLETAKGTIDRIHHERKQRLLGSLSGTVVEIGAGTGANFDYFPSNCRLIAAEPNPAMRRRLTTRVVDEGLDVDIRGARGEQLDLDDNTADAVVSTLVLCSVDNVPEVLAEITRVLKPGGRFIFLEHVAAKPDTLVHRVQTTLHRPHEWVFEGCQTNRDLETELTSAGFAFESIERFSVRSPLPQVSPHIAGSAQLSESPC